MARPVPPSARLLPWVCAGSVALVAWGSHANTLSHGFVSDDRPYVVDNPAVRGPGSLRHVSPSWWKAARTEQRIGGFYRPLPILTFRLDRGGAAPHEALDPAPFHRTNVLLHALAAVLAWWLARRLARSDTAALVGGLLFAAHPVHSEAVAWVSGRAELLAATSALACLAIAAGLSDAPARRRPWLVAAAALLLVLALSSKEGAVALAPILWLLIRSRSGLRSLAASGILLAFAWGLCAAHVALVWWVRAGVPAGGLGSFVDNPLWAEPWAVRAGTALAVLARGAGLLVWPASLSADYSHRSIPIARWILEPAPLMGLAVFALLAWAAARCLRGRDGLSFPLALALLAWLPASNLIVRTGTILGERLLYFPSAGLCLAAGVAGARLSARSRLAHRAVLAATLALTLAGLARTVARNRVWKDEETLLRATLAAHPENVKALRALGSLLGRRGERGEALRLLDRALEVHPGYAQGHADRGACLIEAGRIAEAEAALRKALELHPGQAAVWSNLGVCHVRTGRLEEAVRCFAEAARIDPTLRNARENLARTLEALGRPPDRKKE